MTIGSPSSRPARLRIERLSIRSESALDARRLADALPGLLRARLERPLPGGPVPGDARPGRRGPWSDAADRIAEAIEMQLEQGDA